MRKILFSIIGLSLFIGFTYANNNLTTNELYLKSLSTNMTFKDRRDYQITKQDLDYSCGASSLSTILTYFYNTPTTESTILNDMNLDKAMSSFLDLAKVSEEYGFVGRGMMMDYDNLVKIKIPVIVYLNLKRNDHFSVVRAINDKHVYLADSSMGNRLLTRKQFEKMWFDNNINNNGKNISKNKGKVLLILPNDSKNITVNKNFTTAYDNNHLLEQIPQLTRPFL